MVSWISLNFPSPPPHYIKWQTFLRHSSAESVWIESGTFLGKTTEFLSQNYKEVISIEASKEIYQKTRQRFLTSSNVTLINGLSKNVISEILRDRKFNVISFYLDGHFSDLNTYQNSTPILEELEIISNHLKFFSDTTIYIDDVRCFGSKLSIYSDYPGLQILVEWAQANGCEYLIEHDIFIMKHLN